MFRQVTVVATALVCVAVSGCSVKRYTIALDWSGEAAEAMTCAQLNEELAKAGRIEQQIRDTEAGKPVERPVLYSTAKADADRAVQARIDGIKATRQAKNCAV